MHTAPHKQLASIMWKEPHLLSGTSHMLVVRLSQPMPDNEHGLQRMGQGPRQEGSEEVRLQLARLLISLLRPPKASPKAIEQQLGDLVAIVCSAIADPSPEIKRVRPNCWTKQGCP